MASVEESVYAILKAASGVTSLVGGSTSPRIYPNVIPQDAPLPAISYQRISAYRRAVHGSPASLVRPRIQLRLVAASYPAVKGLAAAVREALDGYVGTIAGLNVGAVFVDDESDEYGDSNEIHSVRQDYLIWHSE